MKSLKISEANIAKQVIRFEMSGRGGGIEIDLTKLGYPEQKMTAYVNYLGGGMLGAISGDCTSKSWKEDQNLTKIQDLLKRHLFKISTPNGGDYGMGQTYEENQKRSVSAY